MSLNIDQITKIENLNHPNDFHIYFVGGSVTFNAANGPLRFWYKGDLVCLENSEDVQYLRYLIQPLTMQKNFHWEIDRSKRIINL